MRTVRIFISSPSDVTQERFVARGVVQRLQAEFSGRLKLDTVFWEYEPLLATADFQSQIPSPADCDIFLAILWSRLGSRLPQTFARVDGSSYGSGTEYEFETALQAQKATGRPHILVYRKTSAPTASLDDEERLLEQIAQKRALEQFIGTWFLGGDKAASNAYHRFDGLARFEEILESHLRRLLLRELGTPLASQRHREAVWNDGSPFRGLDTFHFEHAPVFFGRTRATAEVLDALRHQAAGGRAFLLILGMSGIGKSSLVHAGVVPMLTRSGVISGVSRWSRADFSPSESPHDPVAGLSRALSKPEALPDLFEVIDEKELTHVLATHPELVRPLLRQACRDDDARLVIIIDQLEELFTDTNASADQRRTFVHVLAALASSGLVWIVATLRSDFYPRCEELPELMALKEGGGQYHLAAPTPDEISQMIRLPAQAAGLAFEEDATTGMRLDDVLRDHACAHPETLPLLEFTLDELYQRRSESGLLTFKAYQAIGGLEGSIARRAELVYDGLPPTVQSALERTLDHLVAYKGGSGYRLRARLDELSGTCRALIDAFVAARLFVTELDERRQATARIAHEALIERWPRIQQWLLENEENLRLHSRLTDAVERWRTDPSPDLLLPEGKPLEEAHLLARRGVDLTPAEQDFVARSDSRVRRNHRNRSTLAAALVVLTITAAIGAGVAMKQSNLAQTEAYTARATTDFLVGLFQVSDPWMASGAPGPTITAREVLDRGAARVISELADEPRVQSNFMHAIGSVYQGLGLSSEAEPMLQQALRVRRELLGERHPDVARTLHSLAFVALGRGDYPGAERNLRASIDIWLQTDKDSEERALAMNLLSIAVANQDRFEEALEIQQEALGMLEAAEGVAPTELVNAYNNLGYVLMSADRYLDALEPFERAIGISAETKAIGLQARAMANLASLHQVVGHLRKARTLHEQALELKRLWFEPGHSEIGYSLNNLAWVVRAQGDYPYASRLYEEALENFAGALGEDHLNVAIVRGNLARTYSEAGRHEEAASLFRLALDGIEAAAGARSSYTLPIHVGLGQCYEHVDRLDLALRHYQLALDIGAEVNPEGWDVGMALGLMASLPSAPMDASERDAAFERALGILTRSSGNRAPSRARMLVAYSRHLDATGRSEIARPMFVEALSILKAEVSPEHPQLRRYFAEFEQRYGEGAH